MKILVPSEKDFVSAISHRPLQILMVSHLSYPFPTVLTSFTWILTSGKWVQANRSHQRPAFHLLLLLREWTSLNTPLRLQICFSEYN